MSSRLDGDPSNVSAYYVTNGASTRTEDLDLRADYTVVFRDDDRLMLPAGHIPAMRAAQIKDKLSRNIPVGRSKASMVAIAELGVAPVKRETVQERVYADLRYRLICGFFRPRQALKLMELAEAYGTSAMPVREALSRLVAERALSNAPNRSIIVPVLSQERIDDLRRVRKAVEGLAVRLACRAMTSKDVGSLAQMVEEQVKLAEGAAMLKAVEANTRFHFAIYALSGSEVLIPMIESLWLQFGPYLRHATSVSDEGASRGLRFHRQMVKALKCRDEAAAVAALEADVDLSFDLALTGLTEPLDPAALARPHAS